MALLLNPRKVMNARPQAQFFGICTSSITRFFLEACNSSNFLNKIEKITPINVNCINQQFKNDLTQHVKKLIAEQNQLHALCLF